MLQMLFAWSLRRNTLCHCPSQHMHFLRIYNGSVYNCTNSINRIVAQRFKISYVSSSPCHMTNSNVFLLNISKQFVRNPENHSLCDGTFSKNLYSPLRIFMHGTLHVSLFFLSNFIFCLISCIIISLYKKST